jgi:hypothetical protein
VNVVEQKSLILINIFFVFFNFLEEEHFRAIGETEEELVVIALENCAETLP